MAQVMLDKIGGVLVEHITLKTTYEVYLIYHRKFLSDLDNFEDYLRE